MPIHIDRVDTEIEIVPSEGGQRGPSPARVGRAPAPSGRAALSGDELGRMFLRALDAELDEQMRIRG